MGSPCWKLPYNHHISTCAHIVGMCPSFSLAGFADFGFNQLYYIGVWAARAKAQSDNIMETTQKLKDNVQKFCEMKEFGDKGLGLLKDSAGEWQKNIRARSQKNGPSSSDQIEDGPDKV